MLTLEKQQLFPVYTLNSKKRQKTALFSIAGAQFWCSFPR